MPLPSFFAVHITTKETLIFEIIVCFLLLFTCTSPEIRRGSPNQNDGLAVYEMPQMATHAD